MSSLCIESRGPRARNAGYRLADGMKRDDCRGSLGNISWSKGDLQVEESVIGYGHMYAATGNRRKGMFDIENRG